MILALVIHTDNGDTPNTGSNLHLTNQVGQDDFKLGGGIVLRNTDPAEFAATLNFKQSLLDADGKELASVSKDVPVSIPGGKSIDLSPALTGSVPMKGVDTMKKSYRYRLTIKNGEEVISDTVTGLAFDETNTVFDAPTAPFVADGGVGVEGNATTAIVAQIKVNDSKVATLNTELTELNKQIPIKQASVSTLLAWNKAAKAVPGVVVV